jgi:DNA-binding CsgD family transcriptional regulator
MHNSDSANSPEKPPGQGSLSLLNIDQLATQTIDLDQLLTRDVTPSGSFDIRGEIWKSTFGKLLQALPIPAFLIDESLRITMMNQASGRISPDYENAKPESFQEFFPDAKTANRMLTVVKGVFSTRKPEVAEAILKIGQNSISGRLTFRSIRILRERFLLAMVEDLTVEKKQLDILKRHEQELSAAYDEVEDLVKERTDALMRANQALKVLISGIERKAKDDRRRIRTGLQLSTEPLLALLKAERASERVKMLLDSLDLAINSAFEGESSDWMEFATKLTPREIQVCELIRSGLTSKQIAEVLGITPDAVQSHRHLIRKKIGLERSQGNLAAWLQSYRIKKDWHAS